MSVVNPFGKLFNRKPADPDAELNPADLAQHPAGGLLADAYQTDGMASVQGDPGDAAQYPEGEFADEDLVSLPLLGRATTAVHQRRLLMLLGVGLVVLALIVGWVLQQANRSAQQLTATGQSLMQSQRLAKSVSQALVGSPQAFPEVVESSGVGAPSAGGARSGALCAAARMVYRGRELARSVAGRLGGTAPRRPGDPC